MVLKVFCCSVSVVLDLVKLMRLFFIFWKVVSMVWW